MRSPFAKLPNVSFRSKVLAGTLLLVALVELATMLALNRSLSLDLQQNLGKRLEQQGKAAATWLASGGRHPHRLASRMAEAVGARVTILDRSGNVLGDSFQSDGIQLALHDEATHPEFIEAQAGRVGRAVRADAAQRNAATYWVALPAKDGLVVRLSVPMAGIETTLRRMRMQLWWAGAVGLMAALLLALLLARVVARPLQRMTEAAAQLTRGDYAIDLPVRADDEFGMLAAAMSSLAARLKEKIGELTAEREHLQRVQRIREEFVADASHELRTPVAAIQGFAETLLRTQPDAQTMREFLEVIHRHAQRIGRLVDDLLRLSELDAQARNSLVRQPVSLDALFQRVSQTVQATAQARSITLHRQEASPEVLGDAGAVEQIVENLVGNALRYGRPGGNVWLQAERHGNRVCIVVRDDGPGIAAEHLPRILDRFYRVDAGRSRSEGGTGLGLAIVKSLTENLGGSVEVSSEVERGATFSIWLDAA